MNGDDLPLDDSELKDAHRVAYLIAGYIRKTLTPVEHHELDTWVAADERNVQLFERLTDEENIGKALAWYEQVNTEKALNRVKRRINFTSGRNPQLFRRWAVAVAVVLVIGAAGLTLWLRDKHASFSAQQIAKKQVEPNDRTPGGIKALLTLADGREIILDNKPNGNIAVEGNTEILKRDSSLAYDVHTQLGIKQEPVWNTLSTPKGGMYGLTLPDGSRVWLNAASSLRFPTAFTGKTRNVELTGEAYFEVAKNPALPFIVTAGNTKVQVLGTHFDINAYGDQGLIKTTLLEGSVKVSTDNKEQVITPGQEAQSGADGLKVVAGDRERALGWKEGNFVFHATSMKEVLRDIERWYNINIINTCGNQNHLNATFPRTVSLSKLLAYLEGTGAVQFKWEGDHLIVKK